MTNTPLQYNQSAGKKVHRIEAISDGVFAIAMTLLILDIRLPVNELIHTDTDLWHSLGKLLPKLVSYFLSFMTLGIFWVGHSMQFNYIHESDRNLTWISIFFLMLVSLIPFTTALLSEYIHLKLAITIYWLNILLMGVVIYIHWTYAYRKHYITVPAGSDEQTVDLMVRRRVIIAQSLYAAGMLLCFINTYLSIVVIVLVQLNYAFAIISKRPARK